MPYLSIFAAILLVVGYFFKDWWRNHTTEDGAPYEGMDPDVIERTLKMAEVGYGDIFYDLGSGDDDRLVIAAAMKGAMAYGVELNRLKVWYSRLWIKLMRLGNKANIIYGNIFDINLSGASVVNCYLLQETNDMLEDKLKKELKPGSRISSVAFTFDNLRQIDYDPRGTIYGPIGVYKI